jgi:putative membrane protein
MRFLYTVLINAAALFIVSKVLPGFVFEGGWLSPVIVGAILTVLNYFVKPILKFLSFPLVFLSAGLFIIVINAFTLYLAHYILQVMDIAGIALQVESLLTYLFAAIIFGVANWFIHWFLKE